MPPFNRNPRYVNHTQDLIDMALASFKETGKKFLESRASALVRDNKALGGHPEAFYYRSKLYHVVPRYALKDHGIPPLHPSLHDKADILIQLEQDTERQLKRIRFALSTVTRHVRTQQDLRDLLPDVIALTVPELRALERTKEEGYLFEPGSTHHRQYLEAVDLCLEFQAHRLIIS